MVKPRKKSKWLQQTLWSTLGAIIVGYFLYHTIQGERGWFAMLRMQHEVTVAEATLAKLQKDREELQHRTDLLRTDSMDPDLLDEKSRELLNYSKPNEIVILTPPAELKPSTP
ncbi:MAG: septum formation initiator family protein [Alphaproteobacteria bacterium]|nr:septum formation initiator family protein [Alphaproteobacteria bacterium]